MCAPSLSFGDSDHSTELRSVGYGRPSPEFSGRTTFLVAPDAANAAAFERLWVLRLRGQVGYNVGSPEP